MNEEREEWRSVGPEIGPYEVSSLGRVRSFHLGKTRDIQPGKLPTGYLSVNLRPVRGKPKSYLVHRLVCSAFHGPPCESTPQVNHKDGDKANNRADNLEWITRSGNCLHGWALSQNKAAKEKLARFHRKTTEAQGAEIRKRRAAGEHRTKLCAEFGISESAYYRLFEGHWPKYARTT